MWPQEGNDRAKVKAFSVLIGSMTTRSNKASAPVLLLLLTLTLPAAVQAGNEGSIEGTVVDPTGAVIPGVVLRARNLATSTTFTATSDPEGLFRFPVLPMGSYELEVRQKGFATLILNEVMVAVGARVTLRLSLQVAAKEETIVVSGETPLVEITRSQVCSVVGAQLIGSLPVNGRDFLDFVLLNPGVTRDAFGGLSFAGQRKMNSLLVDGADNNNTFFGEALGSVGFRTTPYQFSQASVAEFQVNTNSYSAEVGRAGAGVINAVTKSGTNEFHGEVFWYYRDRALNATDLIDNTNGLPKSPYHFNQFGAGLGGPLRKNKAFFYFVYDGQRSTAPNSVFLNLPAGFALSPDPTVAAFQQQALDYLRPRATSWVRTFDQDTYFAKGDWQLHPAHQLSARWNGQRFTGKNLEASGPQNSFEHTGPSLADNDTLALSLTSTLSSSLANVARFSYVRSDEPSRANSPNPEAAVFEGGQLVLTVGRITISPRENSIRRGQWSDTLSYSRGRHLWRAGVDVLVDRITFFTAVSFSGSYRFNSLESFGRNLAGMPAPQSGERYIQAFSGEGTSGTTVHPDFVALGAFVQDEWRLRPNLTLNLGLRYDRQWLANVPVSNPSPALAAAGLDTGFTPADGNNFAPRLGFAWSPRSDNRLVVRGGYGIFYWYTPSISSSRAHFQNGITVQTRTFAGASIPLYPNNLCGTPDPSGEPPSCPAPSGGGDPPLLLLFDPDYVQPWAQQGSFGLEFEVQKDLSISASYLWVHGTHLIRIRDINLGTPTTPTTIGIAGTTTHLTFQDYTLPRPIAGFDRVSLIESNARSTYHGLALQASKRFSRSFLLLASYTLSKVIDDVPEAIGVNPPASDRRLLSDPSNPQADRGPGINDQRHRFVLSGIWQLNYANRMSGWPRAILGGWELSSIVTAQSGQPYSGLVNFDLNHDGNAATDRTPGLGRHAFNLPWLSSLDLRVTRNVTLSERTRLQFLWEAFNLFNRANITAVRTTQFARSTSAVVCGIAGTPCLVPQSTGLSAFGTPTATAGPRIMQFAVKVLF